MPIESKPEAGSKQGWLAQIMEIRLHLHDLNNVLTGLLISSGLLKSGIPLVGNNERYLRDVELCCERAGVLASEIRGHVHRLQEGLEEAENDRTMVCDARPSLGLGTGEH